MTRHFLSEPLERDVLERITRAALRAPSAGHAQGVELLVLSEQQRRNCFWEALSDPSWRQHNKSAAGVTAAPVIVIPLIDPGRYVLRYQADDKASSFLHGLAFEDWPVPYWTVDASFTTMLVLLACEAEGLGALFFHLRGRQRAVLDALLVPDRFETIGAIALGKRSGEAERDPRAPRGSKQRVHAEWLTP